MSKACGDRGGHLEAHLAIWRTATWRDMATFGDITRRHGDLAHGDRRILAKATRRRGDMATWRHLAAGGFHLFGASGSTDETDIL